MPSLFRPKIVTYSLPDGATHLPNGKRVTKKTPGALRSVTHSKKWYGRFADGSGSVVRVPLSESKDVARRMLAKLVGDAQLARVGIVDPFADDRRRPILEHLEDFRRYLAGKGNVPRHVACIASYCKAIIEDCGFLYADNLQPSAIVEFLGSMRQEFGRLRRERLWRRGSLSYR
jgi:hypothetical protein